MRIVKFPYKAPRRVHSRRSKNGTPEERADMTNMHAYIEDIGATKTSARDWSEEDLARLSVAQLRFTRLNQARQSRSTSESRVALVAFERGISTKQLARFYYVKRKGGKTRYFDYRGFAEKYDISIDWIFAGFICEHPHGDGAVQS
jgi:hypothetical protein